MAKYKPYSLMSPPFDPTSGGIRVMWGLYGHLLAKGQIAYMNAKYPTSDFVAVYPEIYWGNPAGANTVVRYILQTPGVMSMHGVPGPTWFPPEDQIFVFSKIYDTFGVDDDHLMFLPILNLNLFKAKKGKRKNRCVFVGKGRDIPCKETKGVTRLTREFIQDQGALADYLNTCEIMYSFENPTAMNEIARLCGCRVVFIPEGATISYSKEELEEKYEPGMDGISWGLGDRRRLDVKAFREHYMSLREIFSQKLDWFISETQK